MQGYEPSFLFVWTECSVLDCDINEADIDMSFEKIEVS
jgi:hypothetical protein